MPSFQSFQIESLRALNLSALASTGLNWCVAAARPPARLIPTEVASVHAPPSSACSSRSGIPLQQGQRPCASAGQPPQKFRQTPAVIPAISAPHPTRYRNRSRRRQHLFRHASAPVPLTRHPFRRLRQWFREASTRVPADDSSRSGPNSTCSNRDQHQFQSATASQMRPDYKGDPRLRSTPTALPAAAACHRHQTSL
jgi:hypothetical protein